MACGGVTGFFDAPSAKPFRNGLVKRLTYRGDFHAERAKFKAARAVGDSLFIQIVPGDENSLAGK